MIKKINLKVISKILILSITLIISTMIIENFVYAADANPISGLKDKISDTSAFDDVGGKIIGAIQAIGTIVSIGMLVVLGIKYMTGSAEEKAADKKSMIPYLVGAVAVFMASTIAGAIYKFTSGD